MECDELSDRDILLNIKSDVGEIKGKVETQEKWMTKIETKLDGVKDDIAGRDKRCGRRGEIIRNMVKRQDAHEGDREIHQTVSALTLRAIYAVAAICVTIIGILITVV